jgi:hypothetical protein
MFKNFSYLIFSLSLALPSLAMASEFYTIERDQDSYKFFECRSANLDLGTEQSCELIDQLNAEEMGFFYENLEEEIDGALYKKKWIKRGLFIGGVVGGALLLMTPPGQAVAAAIATSVAAPSGLGGYLAFGGIVIEAVVGLTAVPLIAGGATYYVGGELVEYQLQTMDAESGKAFVEGLVDILDKTDSAVLEKSGLIQDALQNTNRMKSGYRINLLH